ncbi:unnamed protein product [Prorocentrum cordatum]|uniref:Uncharacterized protein n=1 Tax=Prorocentrum cordatum TaxID=2364126 RepID=A0ABN9UWP4_9DINO|nr:unnamed protein product [Polarella glacialis]
MDHPPCAAEELPGEQRGARVGEICNMLDALGFDLRAGFTERRLRELVEQEVDRLRPEFRDPSHGYYLAADIKILLGGGGKGVTLPRGYSVDVRLRRGAVIVTLLAGQHGKQPMLEACRINCRATVFLSHCQAEPVRDTLHGIEDFVQRASKSSDGPPCWLDFFGLDQNNITWTKDKERTKRTIMGPTSLAVMMSPWEGGMILQRAWCCLEIALHALAGHGIIIIIIIIIVLTPDEKERFLEVFRKDCDSIMRNVCMVDVLKAEASKLEEKESVVMEMQAVEGGVPKIHQMIISSMFAALTQVARNAIESAAYGKDAAAQVATDCSNLATPLQAQGECGAQTEELMRRALAIDEKALGPQLPRVATGCNNLATLLCARGACGAQTEELMRRALAIDDKALGPQHPRVATGCNNLAQLLQARGECGAQTEELMRRALAIDEKALGPQLPRVATGCNNLAQLLQARGACGAQTEELVRRALAIDDKALGPQHPRVATGCNNLELMRRALAIDEKALGPQLPGWLPGATTWPSSSRPGARAARRPRS